MHGRKKRSIVNIFESDVTTWISERWEFEEKLRTALYKTV